MPAACKAEDMPTLFGPKIMFKLESLLKIGNPTITYHNASLYTSTVIPALMDESDSFINILMLFFFVFVGLGIAGTVIELTKIGDIPNLNYKILDPQA